MGRPVSAARFNEATCVLTGAAIIGRLIPGGTGLAFHRARCEKEVWEAEERKALLDAERAAIVAELPEEVPHNSDEA